ncbi:glycosyltransferase family 25 protein [Nocardioides sp. NPDC000445]|uniref:glycosyltransferase family 25 protein n=1 Tax=Nocardioides sp. NPDC000445 TaxID=3154257 RepID=UPI00331C5C0A
MTSAADIRTYVINLKRRPDRRAWMTRSLPAELTATFTSDWQGPFDGQELRQADLEEAGYKLFPWQIESDNSWWSRPLKYGEIGCTLSHLACWRHAAQNGNEPYILVLEDDAVLQPTFLEDLLEGLGRLDGHHARFDLLYLGRYLLDPDQEAVPGFVAPGYSHCTFGYLLTRPALGVLLATQLESAVVPVDEFLPSLYIDHPRADLRARFPRQLTALAFDPPIVHQRPKDDAGSDTEDSAFVTAVSERRDRNDIRHTGRAQAATGDEE